MNKLDSLRGNQAKEAKKILTSPKDLLKVITDVQAKTKESRLATVLKQGTSLINYLTSSKVPKRKRLGIVATMLYILSPITIPGPIDEAVVVVWLMKFLEKELKAFATGRYEDKIEKTGQSSPEDNPLLALFVDEETSAVDSSEKKSNPLLNL